MVDKVLQKQDALGRQGRGLDGIVGHRHVGGVKMPDGAALIWFDYRGGLRRGGYLYYSGNQMRLEPGKADIFHLPETSFRHCRYLTNHWYEW